MNKINASGTKLTTDEINTILSLLDADWAYEDVAEMFKLHQVTIMSIYKRNR